MLCFYPKQGIPWFGWGGLAAAANHNKIRYAVTANIVLGLINAIIGASGRFWS